MATNVINRRSRMESARGRRGLRSASPTNAQENSSAIWSSWNCRRSANSFSKVRQPPSWSNPSRRHQDVYCAPYDGEISAVNDAASPIDPALVNSSAADKGWALKWNSPDESQPG